MLGAFSWYHFVYLLQGLLWTVILTGIAFGLGIAGGFVVMLLRISPFAPVRWGTAVVIQVVQGIPMMVLFFLAYFGLAYAGVEMPPLASASLALLIYVSLFLGEIWRGSVESISRTQWEASECLSLTRWQTLRLVIIPQAVRLSLPSTVGFLVQVLKTTSLASVIGFIEVARAGQIVNNAIFQPFLIFTLIGVFYFMLCYPLSRLSQTLERRYHVGGH